MGSASDLATLRPAADVLEHFGVAHELRVLSAHRTPDAMADYARQAEGEEARPARGGAARTLSDKGGGGDRRNRQEEDGPEAEGQPAAADPSHTPHHPPHHRPPPPQAHAALHKTNTTSLTDINLC